MPRRRGSLPVTSSPPMRTRPASGSVRPAMMRSSVLLPEPEAPSSTNSSPCAISRSTSRTTGSEPYRLRIPTRPIDMRPEHGPPEVGASVTGRYAIGYAGAGDLAATWQMLDLQLLLRSPSAMDPIPPAFDLEGITALAKRFIESKLYDEAIQLYEMALRFDPKNMGVQLS